jgi:hypothetical protein
VRRPNLTQARIAAEQCIRQRLGHAVLDPFLARELGKALSNLAPGPDRIPERAGLELQGRHAIQHGRLVGMATP